MTPELTFRTHFWMLLVEVLLTGFYFVVQDHRAGEQLLPNREVI